MDAPAWLENWEPEILEETEHYARIMTPVLGTSEVIAVFEYLHSRGYRVITGGPGFLLCEKLKERR